MYIKRALLENVGPISLLDYEFPFSENGEPKPVVLVGGNGSGKSILLSFIINTLLSAQQLLFDNPEVKQDKVYKYRNPNYISTGQEYYFAKLLFESGLESGEWQLRAPRGDFEKKYGFAPNHKEWNSIPEQDNSYFWTNFHNKQQDVEALVNNNCILYFPPNRFEEPAWLNYEHLIARPRFSDAKHIVRLSNRNIIQYSPLNRNKDWLFDVLFDRQTFEVQTLKIPAEVAPNIANLPPIFGGYVGPSTKLYEGILEILRLVMQSDGALRFGVGQRKNRLLSIIRDENPWVPNIFQLSSGQTSVLNLFLSLLRDFDLTNAVFSRLEDVRGIVLVDEIDSHLHCDLQINVLPALIRRFPHVQFIVTSHSPLFLLGLKKELSDDGFAMLSLPDGKEIGIERFAEFQSAYETFKESSTYQNDLQEAVKRAKLPIVFVEGGYDIKYLRKAASLLGEEQLLEKIDLRDGEGFGNLNKIWKSLDSPLSSALPLKILLIYDCDTSKKDADRNMVMKRTIPTIAANPIPKGIENLFPKITIKKVQKEKPHFIDVIPEITKIVRGKEINQHELLEVNEDEKRNLCDWSCEHGTQEDFESFRVVFQLINGTLLKNNKTDN